jgi:crotonobetainyl-CoA:carnitine CoA-transferase CaiB-like acyl-CoA transferase
VKPVPGRARLAEILGAAGLALPDGARAEVTGADPVLASRFPIGEAAAAALAVGAASASELWKLRGGASQGARVDVRAAAMSLIGFILQRLDSPLDLARHMTPLTALYPTGDGRWVHLHGGFPQLGQGLLDLLGCPPEAEALGAALQRWKAPDLEDAAAARGLCAAMVRTPKEWDAHPQRIALADRPAVEILPIGDAPGEALTPADRPLTGVRVLDLTRVLAGPTCGRTLAAHGADVLRIGAKRLPSIEPFVVETGHGKRNAYLDLERPAEHEKLLALVRGADVFCQGYRSGSLAGRGLGPEALARLRPGIVYVSINCYGHEGPWAGRPGWEQLAQTVTGIAATEGGGTPRLIPAAATDYTTGYLAAYGVMEALRRRAAQGGSWHVRASLVQTGMWLTRLGADRDPEAAPGIGDPNDRLASCETDWGRLTHLRPPIEMERTPPRWERPPTPLGSAPPEWLPRS